MSDFGISRAIESGIENGIGAIKDDINEFFKTLLFDMFDIVLDGGLVVIILLITWCCFKVMIVRNKEKREENNTMLVCLFGLYFIVKMLMKMAS